MRQIIFSIFCWCALSSVGFSASVQVGVVSLDEDSRSAGDLLTSGLTGWTNVALVERNEVDKAVRERSLIGSRQVDVTGLGKMLHADGLIMLEAVSTSDSTNLAVRFVAVNSGVVLDSAVYRFPLPEPTRWTSIASGRLAPLVPKLQVQKMQAIPISILNLHAAVSTPEATANERALNTLLFHRLVLEPDVFVLERKQLGRAEWEKNLAFDETTFWSGGYLLEGVIDRDGAARDAISVNARLIPPNQGPPVSIDVSVPKRDLPAVADLLAQKIMASLRRQSAVSLWDRSIEAERFEQESSWSLRWRMWPEAYAAGESAWALGRHTETVGSLQLKALLPQIVPDDVWLTDEAHKSETSNEGRQYDPVRNAAWTDNAPAATDVKQTFELVGLYTRISQAPEATWRTNSAWLDLGSNILAKTSGVIRHQYLYGWRTNHFDADLPVLRESVRELASTLPRERVRALELLEGACWQETPSAAVRLYRRALDGGEFDNQRLLIFSRDVYNSFWVGWSPADRERGSPEWDSFITSLLSSTNRVERADGALLKLHEAQFDPDIAMAVELFFDAAMDEQHLRFSTNVDFTALDCFDEILRSKAAHPVTLRRTRLLDSWKLLEFARMKHYLQTAQVNNIDRAGWPYANHIFTQEQAKELLPVVDDYIRRIGGDWAAAVRVHVAAAAKQPTDEFDAVFAEPIFDPVRFHKAFVEHQFTDAEAMRLAYEVRGYANKVGWTDDLREVDARLQGMLAEIKNRATKEVASPPVAVLKVTRHLQPKFVDDRGEAHPIDLRSWVEADGKLIMIGSHPLAGAVWPPVSDGPHPIEIDPMTGGSRMLPQVITGGTFLVIGDQLFWIDGDSKIGVLERHSNGARVYEVDLPLFQAGLVTLGKRLFITSADYIAEFSLRDHTVNLLASKRRKPAANQLDDWSGWSGRPRLWLDRNGALFSNVGGTNVWAYDAVGHAWNERPFARGHEDCPWTFSFDSSFLHCEDNRNWVDGSRDAVLSPSREKLPMWPMPFDYPLTPGMVSGAGSDHYFDGTNLWILLPPAELSATSGRTAMIPLKDRDMTLLWFDPRWEIPIVIPLRFDRKSDSAGPPQVGFGGVGCTSISQGLIFGPTSPFPGTGTGDTWFISWTDLHQWVDQNQPAGPNLPRSEPERRRKFDVDHNGVLDADELRAMDADSGWHPEQEKFESRRLLFTFDANHDGKLDAEELKRLALFANQGNFVAPTTPMQLVGRFWPRQPEQLLQELDADHDRTINGEEILALYRLVSTIDRFPRPMPGGFHPPL